MTRKLTLGQIGQLAEIDLAGAGIGPEVRQMIDYFLPPDLIRWTGATQTLTSIEFGTLILIRRMDGIGDVVQELISRLTDGGVKMKTENPRLIQAKVLWDKGVGRALGFNTFIAYLATIPEILESLLANDPNLPLLRLVDPRLGIAKTCQLFGIKFEELGYSDADAVACDARHETPMVPFWVRAHDGRNNRNRRPDVCRDECNDKIFAMTAMVAIMTWVQDPSIIKEGEHVLDCPGSVHRSGRGSCAYLHVRNGEVKLYLRRNAVPAAPHYGSGGFRRE